MTTRHLVIGAGPVGPCWLLRYSAPESLTISPRKPAWDFGLGSDRCLRPQWVRWSRSQSVVAASGNRNLVAARLPRLCTKLRHQVTLWKPANSVWLGRLAERLGQLREHGLAGQQIHRARGRNVLGGHLERGVLATSLIWPELSPLIAIQVRPEARRSWNRTRLLASGIA
jgi:hypothetical protein